MSTGKIAQVEPNSGDMLPIVARSARPSVWRPGPKNSTNFATTPRSRSISVTVRTRSVAVAPSGSSPSTPEAQDLRQEHRDRLAEHRRLGLDPAHAPAQDAEAVHHRRVRVGPDQGVGVGLHRAVPLAAEDDLERYSRFTWWQMPVAGGTTRKLSKACWPQRRNA